jgi:hypothetical protein
MPCTEKVQCFGRMNQVEAKTDRSKRQDVFCFLWLCLLPASVGIFLGLLFGPEDGMFSETSGFLRTTQHHNIEDCTVCSYRRENFISSRGYVRRRRAKIKFETQRSLKMATSSEILVAFSQMKSIWIDRQAFTWRNLLWDGTDRLNSEIQAAESTRNKSKIYVLINK